MNAPMPLDATRPLSPEQRALLAEGRGDQPLVMRLRCDTTGDNRWHGIVADWVQRHDALQPLPELRITSNELSVAFHPLTADRGSLLMLARQLDGTSPSEAFQYTQYSEWRGALAQGEDAAEGRAHWEAALAGAASLVGPRPAYRGQRLSGVSAPADPHRLVHGWNERDGARIAAAAEAAGCTVEVWLQAVWWLLCARLNGFAPFVGGWQHDCRHDYEVMRGAVGCFAKRMPMVVDAKADESFEAWLQRFAGVCAGHLDMQEYAPIEGAAVQAGGEVVFGLQAVAPWPVAGVVAEIDEPMGPHCECRLDVDWDASSAVLNLAVDASRYSAAAARHLLWQFDTLVRSALADPAAALQALPMRGEAEAEERRRQASTPLALGDLTLDALIAQWARRTPQAEALVSGDQRLSYRALDDRVELLSRWLARQPGVQGAIVALDMPRSIDLVVSLLAVWRAGAAYLPLDPAWPAARREAVLADAKPAMVLCAARNGSSPWRELTLAEIPLDDSADAPPPAGGDLADLAYVLYTSGSTGRPKGVMVEHGALLNYVLAASQAMDLAACRRWGLTSTVAADLGNTALFGALANGVCLVVGSDDDLRDPAAFARWIGAHDIDALKIVPSHLEALIDGDGARLPRTLVLGGEATTRTLLDRIVSAAPHCRVFNHYGPTETTVGALVHAVAPDQPIPDSLPLSTVLANNHVEVLDATGRPVAAGELGEVYIGGAQLCRGYLNREVDGAFVPDAQRQGQRLYRTGDLAHVWPDGGLRWAGRADDQVKIRGFRVEPAETQALLAAQTGVRQAAVLGLPSASGMALVAFVVAEGHVTAEALQQAAALHLAAPQRPSQIVLLAELPRLANGKLDRAALATHAHGSSAAPTSAQPADALQTVLAECVAQLVGRPSVGVDEDFFDLGAHSLMVIKLVARLRRRLQVEVAPGLVFDHPSVAALAAAVRETVPDVSALMQRAEQALLPQPA